MTITFNNIPTTERTPGIFTEVDPSRALKGLVPNPHTALIIAQKIAAGTADTDTLTAITNDNLADGFFGPGSILARMCNRFKENNPNTELFALAISDAATGVIASGDINFTGSASGAGTAYLMLGGKEVKTAVASGWSGIDIASAMNSDINGNSNLMVTGSLVASADRLTILAVDKGTVGNYYDIRFNYHEGQSNPVGVTFSVTGMADGANDADLGDAWAVIANTQFQHIIHPYIDAANLTEIEEELDTRFGPAEALPGHGYTGVRATVASAATLGNSRNNEHGTIVAANDSPMGPEDWAAAWGAQAAFNLNVDPARPLHFLKLKGILPPPTDGRFTKAERNTLLYDGVATFIVDTSGNVLIERSITTYQTNTLGLPDPTYLDIQTLFTLIEIRFQYKARMQNRFLIPRFKLADDTFPIQPGTKVANPGVVKQECIALFTDLRNAGLIENLDDFVTNIVVERDGTDQNRVNVLLPPDLINQFRILASSLQFIL